MRNTHRDWAIAALALLVSLILLGACASIGMPEGGPYDMTPPKLIKSSPAEHTLNYRKKKIELVFDENINLEKQQENLVISPPQIRQPKVTAVGKSITIQLDDSLKPDITYSFNFNDGVVDYTEGNPIENFSFAFSTGNRFDTMQMSGVMLDARTLEFVKDKYVGAYMCKEDTAFYSKAFTYVSKTNGAGRFKLLNLRDTVYRIYGLSDDDNNYYYSQPQEQIAFEDICYKTLSVDTSRVDTIKIDSLTALRDTIKRDSLVTVKYTRYMPDTIVLRMFDQLGEHPGLSKSNRADSNKITLTFNSRVKEMPRFRTLDGRELANDEVLVTRTTEPKEVDYWLINKQFVHADSLSFLVDYQALDSLGKVYTKKDTLNFISRKKKKAEKKTSKTAGGSADSLHTDSIPHAKITIAGSKGIYVGTPNDTVLLTFSTPIASLNKDSIQVYSQRDSLNKEQVNYELQQEPENYLTYRLWADWHYGQDYIIKTGNGAFVDVYGHSTDSAEFKLNVLPNTDLGGLELRLKGDGLENAVVELLSKEDNVVGVFKPGMYPIMAPDTLNVRDSLPSTKEVAIAMPDMNGNQQIDSLTKGTDSLAMNAKANTLPAPALDSAFWMRVQQTVSQYIYWQGLFGVLGYTGAQRVNQNSRGGKVLMVKIADLVPGEYYARLFIDENKNGVWDTGDVKKGIQPEMVYYYSKKIEIKKGNDTGADWDVFALPLYEQKPNDLRKVKLEEKKPREDKNIEYYRKLKNKELNMPITTDNPNGAQPGTNSMGGFGGGFGGGGIGGGFQTDNRRF